LCAQADFSKISSTACRSLRAERYRSRQSGQPEIDHGRDERHRRGGRNLLTGPAWSGQRVLELGSTVTTADEVAAQLGEVLNLDVKAFAVPRAGWAEAFEQFGIPKGHTGSAEEMFEAVNAGWMDLGVEGTEHVAGTRSARDVFAAAQNAAKA
jgi:hypothetical protein